MSISQDVKTRLETDWTLMNLLPGGVHRATEISRQRTPSAFDDNGELRACALVKASDETPDGPRAYAGRQLVEVWAYHPYDLDGVENILDRVHVLLQRHKLPNGAVWEARAFGGTRNFEDETLQAAAGVGRYEVVVYRG